MIATAATAGELPKVVARVLGKMSSYMTLAPYIALDTSKAAQLARDLAALGNPPPLPSLRVTRIHPSKTKR